MKKKLAIVVSHPIQHFCPQYASLASNKDLQIKVFFASALGYKKYIDPNFKQEIAWDNLRLDEFDHQFLNGDLVLPADKNIDAENLDSELAAYDPDIVLIYGYFQKLQRRVYRWCRKNRVKIAYVSDSERRQKRSAIKEWIKYPFIKNYFSAIDCFLSVGDENEAYYKYYKVPENKLIRMHFSIDLRTYQTAYANRSSLNQQLRNRFGLSQTDIAISVAGKLVPWKNQQDLITAMKTLEEGGIYLHLFIIGSGQQQESLMRAAESLRFSKVHFPGFVKPEELPAYYSASDIYVHPAAVEPHSLAVSEAIYMGCPVIISDRCGSYGPTDDVQDEKNGYVFKCGDIPSLAEKIAALARDRQQRDRFGEYSHQLGLQFQDRSHGGFVKEMLERLN